MAGNKTKMYNYAIQWCTQKRKVYEVDKSKSKPELRLELELDFELKISITDELLIEILIRLPSIYACRYKAVCKHWHDLISSNYFIKRFINHHHQLNGSLFTPDSFTLMFEYTFWCSSPSGFPLSLFQDMPDHPILSKSYNSLHFLPPLKLFKSKSKSERRYKNIKGAEIEPVHVLTSCHDLLLCSRFHTYYVVNLLTGQWIVLPPVPPLDREQQPMIKSYPKPGLLCYHDWCRFKVILVSNPPEFDSSRFTIRIFCSESGQWTKLMVDWYSWTAPCRLCTSFMIPHNGMLHWLNGYSLVSLDLFNGDPNVKLSRTISLPDGVVRYPHFTLGVSQGHLCVAFHKVEVPTGYLQVWQVEDYHKGLWRLQYRVSLPPGLDPSFKLMVFHPYIRDIIFVGLRGFAYQLNMKTGKFDRYLKLKPDKDCSGILLSRATVLLHQWFPTPLPSPFPLPQVDHTTLFSSSKPNN